MDREFINQILNNDLKQMIQQCLQEGKIILESDNSLILSYKDQICLRIIRQNTKLYIELQIEDSNNLLLVRNFKEFINDLDDMIFERACELYKIKMSAACVYNLDPLKQLDKLMEEEPRSSKTASQLISFIGCIREAIDEEAVKYKNYINKIDSIVPTIDNLEI